MLPTNEPTIPDGIMINDDKVDFITLYKNFSETEAGIKLAGSIRYGRYKPETLNDKEWNKLLGADVNNLTHMALTKGLTRSFIRHLFIDSPNALSIEESELLLLTAITHDQGEAKKGDVIFDLKTTQDEREEITYLRSLLNQQCGEEWTQRVLATLDSKDKESKMYKLFNAIERIGYLRTGLLGWTRKKKVMNEEDKIHLIWMTLNVLGNQIPKLIEYAKEYIPVQQYLEAQRPIIDEIFNTCDIDHVSFNKYDKPGEKETQQIKFDQAKSMWQEF